MDKANEICLTNLMDNLRKVRKAAEASNNEAEIAKIRQFCIDAVTDYKDTVSKIVALINANRDLWKNPYIKGSDTGLHDGKPYTLKSGDGYFERFDFTFNTGIFTLHYKNGCSMYVSVNGISGYKKRTGYCGAWEDHNIKKDKWAATSVGIENTGYHDDMPWNRDLISDTFTVCGEGRYEYSPENLKKYRWGIEGWTDMKKKAERTRERTKALVEWFKEALEKAIEESSEKIRNVCSASESTYVKVSF